MQISFLLKDARLKITLAHAAVCTNSQFSCDVKTSAFRTDKAPVLATALVYKSISTTGLPHAELLTELSIKRTLGSTGGGCPAVCL